eukprot:1139866-Pelagomonas_calceolata.AAC.5
MLVCARCDALERAEHQIIPGSAKAVAKARALGILPGKRSSAAGRSASMEGAPMSERAQGGPHICGDGDAVREGCEAKCSAAFEATGPEQDLRGGLRSGPTDDRGIVGEGEGEGSLAGFHCCCAEEGFSGYDVCNEQTSPSCNAWVVQRVGAAVTAGVVC